MKLKIVMMLLLFIAATGKLSAHAERPAYANDSLALTPDQRKLVASIGEMSEPELVLMLDSLFDADVHDSILFIVINKRIDEMREALPKNQFEDGFGLYPAQRYYGSWNTRMLFPYSDSLYRADTLVTLDLSPGVSGEFVFPFDGRLTSPYGWRDSAFHRGIDIDLEKGDTVTAAFTGMVRFAGKQGGYGNVVIIRHYNGLETVYAHLSRIKCKAGDIVNAGQLIGLGGSTGHSTGSHLHFETRFRGVAINPAYIIDLEKRALVSEKIDLVRTKQGYAVRPGGVQFHTVRRGETITKIAQQYGRTIQQIRTYNGWNQSTRIRQGQQVRVCPLTD